MIESESLLGHATPEAIVAFHGGRPIAAATFVADVVQLAARLPAGRYLVNACADRYAFAVAFGAALVADRVNLLPPSRLPSASADLATRYPDHVVGCDREPLAAVFRVAVAMGDLPGAARQWPAPRIARDATAAIAFTSGTTGVPQAQPKSWGSLVDGARGGRAGLRFADDAHDAALVGTVAPQHMYGLESTVLLALHGPFSMSAAHPLHPEQVAAELARVRGARVLVTTPAHLRALVASDVRLPALDRIVCATAPLPGELAANCEARFGAAVFEIYGCTETGQVAARRTIDGDRWQALPGVWVEDRDGVFWAGGGHIAQPAPLADQLRLHGATSFELLGRSGDLVNVAGKRQSLSALNNALLALDGVVDGAFLVPDSASGAQREARLMAFVVAPGRTRRDVLAQLRAQIDPAFLPRPLVLLDALPRNATGKLPRAELVALARKHG